MNEMNALSLSDFPTPAAQVRAKWAPIYLEPIMGSGERLTIGVAVVSDGGFVVLGANKLSRLQCLYGNAGAGVAFLAEAALEALKYDIADRNLDALLDPHPPIAGLHLGSLRDGAGMSLNEIAEMWLPGLSSLAIASERNLALANAETAEAVADSLARQNTDRLPLLVAKEVLAIRPRLESFFRPDIRPDTGAKRGVKSHKVNIDFTGSNIVANFCTLYGSSPFKAAKEIKTRLWDLKVDRDGAGKLVPAHRQHELLVFRPNNNDPNFSDKQLANVDEALMELESQADQEEIRLRPLLSVKDMADRILQAEAA